MSDGRHTAGTAQHSALDARDDMLAIADAWPDLEVRLGREERAGGEKVSGSKSVGLVINETVSQAMAEVRSWVHFLARVLMDEVTITRTVEYPAGSVLTYTEPWRPGAMDVPGILREIARERVGHFTAHPDEGMRVAFHDDVRAMRALAEQHAYPSGRHWVPVHVACLDHTTTDAGRRTPCPGEYRVLLDPEKPGLIPDMVCEKDPGHRISPLDWQRAARKSGYDPARIRERLAMARGDVG
jgi:hypothetical protein